MKVIVMIGVLSLPLVAHAQIYPRPPYGSDVVIVPPTNGAVPGADAGGNDMPFPSPQAGQQRLLELLDTGGMEKPSQRPAPPGCIYSGQVYSEGATVRSEAGRQVCAARPGSRPDASGEVPLSWQTAPGL